MSLQSSAKVLSLLRHLCITTHLRAEAERNPRARLLRGAAAPRSHHRVSLGLLAQAWPFSAEPARADTPSFSTSSPPTRPRRPSRSPPGPSRTELPTSTITSSNHQGHSSLRCKTPTRTATCRSRRSTFGIRTGTASTGAGAAADGPATEDDSGCGCATPATRSTPLGAVVSTARARAAGTYNARIA
jgi:hypothetical protein